MGRFIKVFKRYWKWFLIGIIAFVAGLPMVILSGQSEVLAIIGGILLVGGLTAIGVCYMFVKDRLDATCKSCEKMYSTSSEPIRYEYSLVEANDKYSTNTATKGQYEGTDFIFSINIVCPHCGSNNILRYKYRSKDKAKAISSCERHIQSLLKLEDKEKESKQSE